MPEPRTTPPPSERHPATSGGWTRRWQPGLRWFAAEFFVVLAGILVAFWLQAWWAGRQAAETEGTFLRQLLVDARENERRIDQAIITDSTSAHGSGRLAAALRSSAALPAADSLEAWIRPESSDFRPVLGTIAALQNADGARVIRDDELRAAVVSYAADMAEIREQLRTLESAIIDHAGRRGMLLEPHRLPDGRHDFAAMRDDPAARALIAFERSLTFNRTYQLQQLRQRTREFADLLERHLRINQDSIAGTAVRNPFESNAGVEWITRTAT